jgi:fatty acid desaturase
VVEKCYVRFLPILPIGGLVLSIPGHVQRVILLGIVVVLLGVTIGIPVLWTLGMIVLVIGIVLALFGTVGHEVGGRVHYW